MLARVLGPRDGDVGFLRSIGVRFMIEEIDSGGGFSLVEHPMAPRALAAPLHRHTREDEYSFVLEGEVGALLGKDALIGKPGDLIFKPRNQWHTFWNASDRLTRILEIISPAGFEGFFHELSDLGGVSKAEPQLLMSLCERYGLEINPASVPDLVARFGYTWRTIIFGNAVPRFPTVSHPTIGNCRSPSFAKLTRSKWNSPPELRRRTSLSFQAFTYLHWAGPQACICESLGH
jgi:quercetin dioxygenase-like cupin family protein